ncbi:MAG TPA: threonine/serine dehydratase [Thermoanaerobaculia bacterium]|nr:threonine/serine dehydratase [Thermoanaerobaculia bacterium]
MTAGPRSRGASPRVLALAEAVGRAAETLRGRVVRTPVEPADLEWLGRPGGAWLKLEDLQETGSFKLRGATNRILGLSPEQLAAGVVAASSGNHGVAVATALAGLGARGTVFVPETVSPAKAAKLERLGAEVRRVGDDSLIAEREARRFAEATGRVYVSPYNDLEVIAGQGTVAVELLEQVPDLEAVLVTVGGGGLIAGIAAWLRVHRPQARIVGCLPERSPVMAECLRRGEIVEVPSRPTLSDGSAGGLEAGAITFELCRELIDDVVLVGEDEIAAAMVALLSERRRIVEGAAAVALAGYRRLRAELAGATAGIVVCGGNVSLSMVKRILRAA